MYLRFPSTRGLGLALLFALTTLGTGTPTHAQEVDGAPTPSAANLRDQCRLAARASSARPEAECLQRRTTLEPVQTVQIDPLQLWRIAPLPIHASGSWRGGYAADRNNGALWSGRGIGGSMSFGAWARIGLVTIAVEPVVHRAQNRAFDLPDGIPLEGPRGAYPWAPAGLDWPLRPGASVVQGVGLGESFVDATLGPASVGFSSERLWWGPARRFPLLFSGTGEGFVHAYARTARPVRTYAGDFTGEVLWGRVSESDHFDARTTNDHRLLGAFQIGWSLPDYLPGLELTLSVVRHEPLEGNEVGLARLSELFTGDPSDDPAERAGLSMGSLAFRWSFPEAGAEIYGELGRGEGFLNLVPGVSDPDLARIWMLGLSRTSLDEDGSGWRFAGEIIRQSMELPQPTGSAGPLPVGARHGHTHRGALLGAYIGPGSNAQFLAVDRVGAARSVGLFAERVRRDDDTYWRDHAAAYGFRGHDVEWTVGVRGGGWIDAPLIERITGPISAGFEGGLSRRKNRNFVRLDGGATWEFLREWNPWLDLSVTLDFSWRGLR